MRRTRFERILYYLTAPKCLCCEKIIDIDDFAYCKSCFKRYDEAKAHKCSFCLKSYDRCLCSNKYLEAHFVKRLIKLFRYKPSQNRDDDGAENKVVYNLKISSRIDVVRLCTLELSLRIRDSVRLDNLVITNVPRSAKRIRAFGMDHMAKLAKSIARELDIPYVRPLQSLARGVQKKKRGEERMQNAAFDYRSRAENLTGKKVLILDDVVTTGASLGGCAMLLRGLGAKEIIGVCLGIAYSDKYTPFNRDNRY